MTTAQALLKNLQDQDVELKVVGSKLRVCGPEEVLTEKCCARIAEHKAALIELLSFTAPNSKEAASDECIPVGENEQSQVLMQDAQLHLSEKIEPLPDEKEQGQLPNRDASCESSPLASSLDEDDQKVAQEERPEKELSEEELGELQEIDSVPFDTGLGHPGGFFRVGCLSPLASDSRRSQDPSHSAWRPPGSIP